MKKLIPIAIFIALGCVALMAADQLSINLLEKISNIANIDDNTEITFSDDAATMTVTSNSATSDFAVANVQDLTFTADQNVVSIVYNGTDATIVNPYAFSGVEITKDGADITVNSTIAEEIEYQLSGTATDGSFKIYTTNKYILTLDGVSITNADGAAINCQGSKKTTVNLVDGTTSTLTDGSKYTTVDGEDMKGTFFSEGKIAIQGSGTLNVVGLKKHGIVCDDNIEIISGKVNITNVASDAIHSKDKFVMSGGELTLAATGDGIDGDEGTIEISGGTINITTAVATTKGIKSDGDMNFTGGTINITTTGGVTVTDGDPSYCTAIKGKAAVNVSGGDITITASGEAGKGISADGDINISGGKIGIKTTGNGAKYTDATNVVDSYAATCITGDANINITGGELTLESTGTAGKCISADVDVNIGSDTGNPYINAKTSGAKFLVSGSGNNADYANPKAIKADGNLTVNSGTVIVSTTKDGGEGLESKNILTINGGTIEATTYDDAINASNHIQINGGNIYCYSSGNDGIDSNGTLTITGGVVISSGTTSPEEGFDCDQNTFKITGGILIGTGGGTSTPTSSVCTQRSVIYSFSNATSGNLINVKDASGNEVLTYKLPRTYNSCTMLFSSPNIGSTGTYTISTGGSVSGGTEFHGYTTGGTYSGGTQATTFTPSSMVTTIGSGGGGGGGGGFPGRP